MAVIYENNKCKLIKHERNFRKYKDTEGNLLEYKLSEKLFNNFKVKRKEKESDKSLQIDQDPDISRVKDFLTECKSLKLFNEISENKVDRLKNENMKLMNEFYDISIDFNEFYGENNLSHGHITNIGTEHYLIPPKCNFFNKPIGKIYDFLDSSVKFDLIVVDPPFQCKYIKRLKKTCTKKSYEMMTNEDILKIPIKDYIHEKSIVVIWCTNSLTHEKFIKQDVMNEWNLKLIGIWKWVKIDKFGETFCPFNNGSKKPYEKVFIATHAGNDKEIALENDLIIFSQPSSIHSHKPPLIDFFRHLLPTDPKCLEIFARSLYENFTSVGLECLKLQNIKLFDES